MRAAAVLLPVLVVPVVMLSGGCAADPAASPPPGPARAMESVALADSAVASEPGDEARRIVRSGDLTVEVSEPAESAAEVERRVEEAGGFVEQSTSGDDANVWLHARVPADRLEDVMDAIAALGDVEHRSLSATDVTEQFADLETRLANARAFRERLRELLDRATDVEDVLAIERELNRIQVEIERMQGRLDRLESQVELSALSVRLERKPLLGPLGYLGYGLWWAVSKLFVIR